MKHKASVSIFFLSALFLPCFVTAESFSVKNDTGLLWTDSTGSASYAVFGVKAGDTPFFMGVEGGWISSDLSLADFTLPVFRIEAGVRSDSAGFTLSGGYASYGELVSETGDYRFSSGGARGGYISGGAFFSIRKMTVRPSFLYAFAEWEDGDFYWFFGKPDIRFILLPEISLEYDGKHAVTVRSLFLDGGVLNNGAETLGRINLQLWNLAYRFTHERPGLFLKASLGWLYGDGDIEGALTAVNQNYFAFPYGYFNFDGTGNIHAGYGAVTADMGRSLFRFRISGGVAQMLYTDMKYSYHYKEKRLFGGREKAESREVDMLKNAGCLFFSIDAGVRDVPLSLRRGFRFSGGLRKALIIPWNVDLNMDNGSSGGRGLQVNRVDSDFMKTMLLSGLSFYIQISA